MSEVKDRWICESCGADSSGKFCTKCGASRPKLKEWTCTCGKKENTGKFCSRCGKQREYEKVAGEVQNSKVSEEQKAETAKKIETISETEESEESATECNMVDVHNNANQGEIIQPERKKTISIQQKALMIFIAIIVAGYFSFDKIIEKIYTAQCEKYIELSIEIVDTYNEIEKLVGDAEADETKNTAKTLYSEVERLKWIYSVLDKMPTPKGAKPYHDEILRVMDVQQKYLTKSAELLASNDRCLDKYIGKVPYVRDKNERPFKEIKKEYDETQNYFREIIKRDRDLMINYVEIPRLINLDEANSAIKEYISKKVRFDLDWYDKKRREYWRTTENRIKELKQKNEVVFLASNVEKTYSSVDKRDVVKITGRFYNGTEDFVTGVGTMLVDLKLNAIDKEITSVVDISYQDKNFEKLSIRSKKTSPPVVIRLKDIPAGIPEGTYHNFEVNVHKIHWNARKVVNR